MKAAAALEERLHSALGDAFLRKAVRITVERLREGKRLSTGALGNWEAWRAQGEAVRAHTIANLDYYLALFASKARENGIQVHFAADAAEALDLSLGIARNAKAKTVVKSKSMVSEELHLNAHFSRHGIDCVETDLGEWIIQLAGETPSHIILPAIHKNRRQIRELFEAQGAKNLSLETSDLAGYARLRLREKFEQAEVGMTGCNFAVAGTGSVALFTNEGNGRMVTTLPGTHIVMMGMERIVPGLEDLELMANLLPRSATGQKITTYLSLMSGPRRDGESDGPGEVHVIILDNGRSRQLGDPDFQSLLNCIRCGACLNVCPVYRHVGGHAYGSVYSGPIGAVITPRLKEDKAASSLAEATSLCGACSEACPVRIPLHDMLVLLRKERAEKGWAGFWQGLAFGAYSFAFSKPWRYRAFSRAASWLRRTLPGQGAWLGPLSRWSRHRDLPAPPPRSFRDLWKNRNS